MLVEIFTIISPVILIALTGFFWDRARMPFDTNMVSYLVTNVGAPCLILSALLSNRPDPEVLGIMAGAGLLVCLTTALISIVIIKVSKLSVQVYLPPLIFPNTGNMGLPLVLFAFGDEGLALAVAFFATFALLQFSLGVFIASGHASIRGVLGSPVFLAAAGGAALVFFDVTMPRFALKTLDVLGGLAIPLMLLALGISLSRLKVASVKRSAFLAASRLILGAGAGLFVAALLGLDGPARGAVVIQAAMPAAVFNYLFALRYNTDPGEVAGLVVTSTILSFATLPVLLLLVL